MSVVRRMIVRAAPTCTLWSHDFTCDVYRFRWSRRLVVTETEIAEAG